MTWRMGSRGNNVVAWIGGLGLVVLHHDFWRERGTELVLGWLPQELAYRLGWMALAALYLVWFCRFVWVEED